MGIGNRIRKRREYLGMSQDELAKRCGYKSRSTINKIEKEVNDITQSKIVAFANALDTSIDYLMGIDKNNRNEIGRKITELRKSQNKSLYEMSNELHIDIDVLDDYEKGIRKIPIEILDKIASYFNVSIDEITTFDINKKTTVFTTDERIIRMQKKFFDNIGEVQLTDDEVDKIIEYVKFLISQRKSD